MKRGGLFVIHAVIAALFAMGLTANTETLREQLRLGLARFFSRPWTAIQESLSRAETAVPSAAWAAICENRRRQLQGRQCADLQELHESLTRQRIRPGESVLLLEVLAERRTLLLGAGWRAGVRPGQMVYGQGRFLGFVDRVEEHLSRVRSPGHPRSRYGARIQSEDGKELQTVLLSGEGSNLARASAGRRLESNSQGGLAWRDMEGGALLVGRVQRDSASGETAIRLATETFDLDRVGLASRKTDVPLEIVAESVFSAFPSRVLSASDSNLGEQSWLVDGGVDQGVGRGDLLVRDGLVIGMVDHAGRGTSRVRPLVAPSWTVFRCDVRGRWSVLPGSENPESKSTLSLTRARRHFESPFGPEGLIIPESPQLAFAAQSLGDEFEILRFSYRDERRRLLGRSGN